MAFFFEEKGRFYEAARFHENVGSRGRITGGSGVTILLGQQ
jgi:hypothetical protein